MIPKKPAPNSIRGEYRLSEKIMPNRGPGDVARKTLAVNCKPLRGQLILVGSQDLAGVRIDKVYSRASRAGHGFKRVLTPVVRVVGNPALHVQAGIGASVEKCCHKPIDAAFAAAALMQRKRLPRFSPARDDDQQDSNSRYSTAVIDPVDRADHEAFGGPADKSGALSHEKKPRGQNDDSDERQ